MPPHAPCRLQRFINSTDEIEVHLCLHTPRADCNQKMQSRCARQVLCLHTPRADCNISPCVVKGKEYRLCLHTPRADCNEKRPRLSACSMPLPPHAPCRLQRRFRSIWLTTSSFASTRPVQIATVRRHQSLPRQGLCLHTPRADCNRDCAGEKSQKARLCLHTPRADCNASPLSSSILRMLCLHTPRADCNGRNAQNCNMHFSERVLSR